jgi:two-component system, sensor histidine kinase LadS
MDQEKSILFFFFFFLCFSFTLKAEVVQLSSANQLKSPLSLTPYLLLYEDKGNNLSLNEILCSKDLFTSFENFRCKSGKSTYWAKFIIENHYDKEENLSLSFKNLTYVELYEFRNDTLINKHLSGLFRPEKEMTPGDQQDYFNINLKGHEKILCILKVNHVKGYLPKLFFTLQDRDSFLKSNNLHENISYLIFGAFLIFFFYCLLSYFFNHYLPFVYLAFFTLGISLYSFDLSGNLCDFFPQHPVLIWRLNIFFTSLSGVSGLMLLTTFFKLKKQSTTYQQIVKILIILQVLQFIAGQTIIELTGNFWWMTLLAIIISFFILPVIVLIPLKLWEKLAKPQRLFAISVFIYTLFLLSGLILLVIVREGSNQMLSYLSNLIGIMVIIFFIISLGEQIRQIEVERNAILEEMNTMKSQQNRILEALVDFRTRELKIANEELQESKEVLLQRNSRIELLLRELHHRVKNNLQLISSFYELRRNDPHKKSLQEITDEGQNRVQIMAFVHDMLYHGDNSNTIGLEAFVNQIVMYLTSFFNVDKSVAIKNHCEDFNFDMDTSIPLGLILNELLTNAIKYANPENGNLEISITVSYSGNYMYQLIVSDNGKEIEKEIIPKKEQSFGLHMIYLLSKQLNGNFSYNFTGKNNFIVNFMDTEGRRQFL